MTDSRLQRVQSTWQALVGSPYWKGLISALDAVYYIAVVLLFIGFVTYLVAPETFRVTLEGFTSRTLTTNSSGPPQPDQSPDGQTDANAISEQAKSEPFTAYGDHWHIALWFASCLGHTSIGELPDVLVAQLTPFGMATWSGAKISVDKPPAIQLREVSELSLNLYRDRIGGAAAVRAASKNYEIMQWIIILLGLITTIVVSLSSTEYGKGEERLAKSLRLVAITLPALGTMVAAANAFYAPSQKALQATRTLASLGQLHSQIALEVWATGCPPANGDPKNPNLAKIDDKIAQWIKRYQEIQSSSSDTANPDGQSATHAAASGTATSNTGAPH